MSSKSYETPELGVFRSRDVASNTDLGPTGILQKPLGDPQRTLVDIDGFEMSYNGPAFYTRMSLIARAISSGISWTGYKSLVTSYRVSDPRQYHTFETIK